MTANSKRNIQVDRPHGKDCINSIWIPCKGGANPVSDMIFANLLCEFSTVWGMAVRTYM